MFLGNSKEFVKDNYGSKIDVDSKDFEEFSPRPTGICVKQQFLPCKIPKDTFKSAESIPQPTVLKVCFITIQIIFLHSFILPVLDGTYG